MSYDGTKPVDNSSQVSSEIRENFRALKDDGIVKAKSILSGTDASKAASPSVGDMYIATDTTKVYRCSTAGTWTEIKNSMMNGTVKNLKVSNSSSSVVNLTADYLALVDSNNIVQEFSSVSLSASSGATGSGGIDTGSLSNNTIYYIWVIAKTDGTKALMLSASSTSPTMPSGYTFKSLFSCVGTDNASNFINFIQTGRKYNFSSWAIILSNVNTTGSWTSIDLTPSNMTDVPGFVPSALSDYCYGSIHAGVNNDYYTAITNDNTVSTGNTNDRNKITQYNYGQSQRSWEMNIITTDTLYGLSLGIDGRIYLHGFEINKLWA